MNRANSFLDFSSNSTKLSVIIENGVGYSFFMQITHSTVLWMFIGGKMQSNGGGGGSYRKVHSFLVVIIVPRTYHSSYKSIQMNIERLNCVPQTNFMFLIF